MTALEEFPETWDVPETDEARKSWRIEHARQLDWALRRLGSVRHEAALVRTRAQAEIDRIRAWEAQELGKLGRDAGFFEGVVGEYALAERARDPERKSITSPYGRVSTRAGRASWDIDPAALLPWLRENHPGLVKVTEPVESVDKAGLKLAFETAGGVAFDPDTGETLPGVKVTDTDVKVTVDVDLGFLADDEEPGR